MLREYLEYYKCKVCLQPLSGYGISVVNRDGKGEGEFQASRTSSSDLGNSKH